MKTRYVVAFFAIVISTSCFAQNKTLGVGAGTPNANAALHIESPTNNQGFIMPRLTTAQRTAMAGLPLTTADDGLMVYDKDIKKIYIWDGAAWQLAAGLNLPFTSSTSSPSPALNITNTGAGNGAFFQVSNATNSSPAVNAATDGTGPALALNVTNASNSFTALSIVHTGTGNAISANRPIQATQFIGDGSALTNLPAFALPFTGLTGAASPAFQVTHTGNGHAAGDFRIQNTASSASALRAQSDGSGAAFTATNIGTTGFAANFDNTDATNASPTVFVVNQGTAPAAVFNQTNALNAAPVLSISSAGSGPSITATGSIEALQFVGDGSLLSGVVPADISITAASENVSIGKGAGTSFQGVSIGDLVGGGGNGNIFMGKLAGNANTGDYNVFTGWQAGQLNTTGSGNTFLGAAVGIANTTGGTNTFLGWHAGQSNASGSDNVFVGGAAGFASTGNNNVFVGRDAGTATSTGNSNVFVGWNAGASNFDGTSNIFIGAGTGSSVASGVSQTTGDNNILIGVHAGVGTDGLNDGVAIGNGAVVNGNNSVAIGAGALVSANNSIVLGTASTNVGIGISSPTAKLEVTSIDALAHTGAFSNTNGTSTGNVINVGNLGNGNGIYVVNGGSGGALRIEHTFGSSVTPAVHVENLGSNVAGNFLTNNPGNTTPALFAQTNGTGPALQLNQSNGGVALEVQGGSIKYPVFQMFGSGTIPNNAVVVEVTANSLTINLPAGGQNGQVLYVINNTGSAGITTVGGFSLSDQQWATYIRIGGAWKRF